MSQIESPNASNINAFYPYVDFDPIEKCIRDGIDAYAHFVYTREKSIGSETYAVYYASSNMVDNGNEDEYFEDTGDDAGYATIAMYAEQVVTGDNGADFDVVFISNHEGSDFHVYSLEGEFLNETCTSISTGNFDDEKISSSLNESGWQSPGSTYIYGPVNAIFGWKSEEVCWTHNDSTDQVVGDFEINSGW
jgi:hypothetical protein